MACQHNKKFDAKVSTVRDEHDPTKFFIEVKVNCVECGLPFRFGHSFVSSSDGAQLTAVIHPGLCEPNRPPAEMLNDYDYLRGIRVIGG